MGTFPKRVPFTSAQICEMYQGGEGMAMIGLRCRRSTAWVRDVLTHAGIEIRTPQERALVSYAQRKHPPRRKPRPQPPGSNPWGQP